MTSRFDNQASQRRVSPLTAAHNLSKAPWFKEGYDSVMKDRPFNYDIEVRQDAIAYARGRSFAIWVKQFQVPSCRWTKGVLSKAAQERLIRAIYHGYLL